MFVINKIYLNVHKVIKILATLSATTCTAERLFSTLRRFNTYSRNTLGQIDLVIWLHKIFIAKCELLQKKF